MNSDFPLLILQCPAEHVKDLSEQVEKACKKNEPLIISDKIKVYAFDERLRLISAAGEEQK